MVCSNFYSFAGNMKLYNALDCECKQVREKSFDFFFVAMSADLSVAIITWFLIRYTEIVYWILEHVVEAHVFKQMRKCVFFFCLTFDKHFCRRTNKQESIKLNSNETNVTKVYLKNRIYYHRIQPEGLTAVFFLNTETLFLFFLFWIR